MDRNLLPAIAAFSEVARAGSFTRAAAHMGISPSALSQIVRMLEKRLDVRLLNRSTRSVSVTEDGRRLLADVNPGLAMITDAVGNLGASAKRPAGGLRINTSGFAARYFLEPHLGEFRRRYPLVNLEIIIDDGLGNIIGEGCDAGIRLRESVNDSMIAIPISPPMAMAVVGSPAFFAGRPPPQAPSELEQFNCVGFRPSRGGGLYHWDFVDPATGRPFEIAPQGSLITNSDEMMISAALQGVGLVMHMEIALREPIARGALLRVLEAWCPPFDGFDLYLPSREQMPAKLRALVDFLVEKRENLGSSSKP